MAIDPLKGPAPGAVDNRRADAASRGDGAGHVHGGKHKSADSSTDATDTLSLSETAATLPSGDVIPSGGLTAEQLQQITQKLASGAYNTPDSVDRLAGNLLKSTDLFGQS